MQPTKVRPKTMEKYLYAEKLYKEGLKTQIVSMRSGLSRTRFLEIKAMLDAKKTP